MLSAFCGYLHAETDDSNRSLQLWLAMKNIRQMLQHHIVRTMFRHNVTHLRGGIMHGGGSRLISPSRGDEGRGDDGRGAPWHTSLHAYSVSQRQSLTSITTMVRQKAIRTSKLAVATTMPNRLIQQRVSSLALILPCFKCTSMIAPHNKSAMQDCMNNTVRQHPCTHAVVSVRIRLLITKQTGGQQ